MCRRDVTHQLDTLPCPILSRADLVRQPQLTWQLNVSLNLRSLQRGPGGGDSASNAAILGGGIAAAAVAAAALTACIGFILVRRRSRNDRNAADASGEAPPVAPMHVPATHLAAGPHMVSGQSAESFTSSGPSTWRLTMPPTTPSAVAPVLDKEESEEENRSNRDIVQIAEVSGQADEPGGSGQGDAGTQVGQPDVQSAGAETQVGGITTSIAMSTDLYNTSVAAGEVTFAQRKGRLTAELDHMRHRDEQFMGQYAVLPWTERREGGQGVVQFMRSTRTEEFVAVKFFLSCAAYDAEARLYKVDVLRSMMPAIRMDVSNEDTGERNSRGYPWPPFMVLEKGESLQEWKARTKPAFSTILDVRSMPGMTSGSDECASSLRATC